MSSEVDGMNRSDDDLNSTIGSTVVSQDYGATQVSGATLSSRTDLVFTLQCLFQVVTGCSVFFAMVRISPLVAIVGTLLVTPAIIRTGQVSDLHRRHGMSFDFVKRLRYFAGSIGVVLLSLLTASIVFLMVSSAFGAMGWSLSLLLSDGQASPDAAVVGFVAGMVWGVAGAIVAVGCVMLKIWWPIIPGQK